MVPTLTRPSRRVFIGTTLSAAAFFTTRGLFAEQLARDPVKDRRAVLPRQAAARHRQRPDHHQRQHHSGRRRDHPPHRPGRWTRRAARSDNATIEIWQCDANEVYLHTGDSAARSDQQDKNFQGFGRFTTGSTGEYYFRTIKPVPYPGRPAPHIHVKVKKGGRELLTTQINIAGHPGNDVDGVVLEGRICSTASF